MPVDDPSDLNAENRALKKRVERLEAGTASSAGDSTHEGAGFESIVLGADAEATDDRGITFGAGGYNDSADSVCIGYLSLVTGAVGGIAIGRAAQSQAASGSAFGPAARAMYGSSTAVGASAVTTATNQVMLGRASDTVVVPGTFSNPSARRLKQNITPAPELVSIFPTLYEWEYIEGDGRRRIGPLADDLLGTDGERFLTFDDEGRVAGIESVALLTVQVASLVAQVAQLSAELAALKNEMKG
jgi:hypothetical protein